MAQILKTKDYSIFNRIKGNRRVKKHHVANLTVKILSNNMLEYFPIQVNKDLSVIDGQHRLVIAENNKLEIYYIIIPHAGIDDVIEVNSAGRKWAIIDYIESYAERGNRNYVWLIEMMQKYSLSSTNVVESCYGYTSSYTTDMIRNGQFEPSESMKRLAEEKLIMINRIRPFVKASGNLNFAVVRAILRLYDEGKAEKLLKNLQASTRAYTMKSTTADVYSKLNSL